MFYMKSVIQTGLSEDFGFYESSRHGNDYADGHIYPTLALHEPIHSRPANNYFSVMWTHTYKSTCANDLPQRQKV